jgi:hypothetical protein
VGGYLCTGIFGRHSVTGCALVKSIFEAAVALFFYNLIIRNVPACDPE